MLSGSLYPEGGGQPTDFGFIDAAPIQSVQKTSSERILHTSPTPFSPGSSVTVTVDWARRYDHMQQHSAQHLISAVFIKLFSMPTLSWWLSSAPSECFIELDASELTSEQLLQAEAECNRLIREALPMHIHTFPSVDAALADASFTARLPAHKVLGDHLKGTVRVIEIEGVDMNPCGGTHLQRTSELQLVHLPRHDKAKGHVRVFFFAGDRALRSLSSALSTQRELAALLSTTGEGQPEVVRKLQAELRALLKQNKLTSAALAEYVAKDLAQSKADVVHYHQVEGALPFLQSVCDAFTALTVGEGKEGGGEGKEGKEGKVLFLTASEGPEGKEGQWVLFGEGASELAGDVGKAMDGRGGGKGKRVQGKAARVDKRADALKLIEDRLGKAKQ